MTSSVSDLRRAGPKRVDRVMDLQNVLRAREIATVGELARDLGVSERTVLRDLGTLRSHGVPLETQAGPGGGVRLQRDRGIVSVHLALDECIALWLASTLSASVVPLPWSASAERALRKIQASLPKDRARALRAVARRVVVGRPASPRVYAELGRMKPELLPALERAFAESYCLAFDYIDRHGRPSRRSVEPHGLMVETPAWYILCRDLDKAAVRLFRLDRIRNARVLADRPFSPDLENVYRAFIAQIGQGADGRSVPPKSEA